MSLRFDFRDFERAARNIGVFADQIPFALAQVMNDGIKAARTELIEKTWPSHVTVRNKGFMRAALRSEFASKKKLRAAVYDRLERASLGLHASGGTKKPRGSSIAIPSVQVAGKRRSSGVPKGLRPRAIPNSFVKGDSVFQRFSPENKKLRLMYTLKPSVSITGDVPFEDAFQRVMRREVMRSFGPRMRDAMATRRKPRSR